MNGLPAKAKYAAIALVATAIGFFIGTFLITIPMPKVDAVTKTELGFAIRGRTRPGAAVMLFGQDGTMHAVTRAEDTGRFTFDALAVDADDGDVLLRALDNGWRASPRVRVSLASAEAEERPAASSTAEELDEEELPPIAIPPTSTAAADDTEEEEEDEEEKVVESIEATASVANATIAAAANQTVTVTVEDQDGDPVDDAQVKIMAYYPTENETYVATGSKGSYRLRFKVPENIGSGTNVLLDVTVNYQGLTSTARTAFTIK